LLRIHGYRAGEHMMDMQGQWTEATSRQLMDCPVVSSYVLYEIAIFDIGSAVLPLNWFQRGRAQPSHAAPYDAKFKIQANLAIGGNFFKGNMNAKMTKSENNAGKELPWTPDTMPWGEDPHFPEQKLREANRDIESARRHRVKTCIETEAFMMNYNEWLPTWLPSEVDASKVQIKKVPFYQASHLGDTADKETVSVHTPALGEHTKFLLHGVLHSDLSSTP